MKKTTWPGNWKVACDVCGFWFPSGEMKERWDGLMVCEKDFEHRHPQTLYRYKDHPSVPDFVRKDGTNTFIFVCDFVSIQGRADWGTADCARADYLSSIDVGFPYAVANMAIASEAMTGYSYA